MFFAVLFVNELFVALFVFAVLLAELVFALLLLLFDNNVPDKSLYPVLLSAALTIEHIKTSITLKIKTENVLIKFDFFILISPLLFDFLLL